MPLLYSHEYFEMGLSIGVCNAHGYANMVVKFQREGYKITIINCCFLTTDVVGLELVSKELNHLKAILHVYAESLIFMK